MINFSYILAGFIVGISSGFLGLGGGLVVIPILVYIYGFTQQQAQGTSLAMMIPPITLLAALRYYHAGNVKITAAIFLATGFAVGGLFGAHIVQYIPNAALKKIFGIFLFSVSIKMIFWK